MPRLLIINPNTSEPVTRSIATLARDELGDAAEITAVTARFGGRYIASRATAAIAAHAVLDAAATALRNGAAPDAIILGCFGDPGLAALREATGLPVLGFATTGFTVAARLPGRFLVATGGTIWCEMLSELAITLGVAPRIAGYVSIDEAASDPDRARAALAEAAARTGAARVVVGGAGLIPVMPRLAEGLPVPFLDPHRATLREALRVAREDAAAPAPSATEGLSEALSALLRAGAE
ncbi:aspartate/glutamate racemase family protein [Muricoccus radiodurans]|uniref:aspartate/glutamate racemase family protein n=1 Tax=Muricoccus radiodurans TaxID=2231721 RepID=UPI003CEB56F4